MEPSVDIACEARAPHGECPCWDPRDAALRWVDITDKTVHRFDPGTGLDVPVRLDVMPGALSPSRDRGLIMATNVGFLRLSSDGSVETIALVENENDLTRMNDGKCDAQGRFFAGTIAFELTEKAGTLYRLDSDGAVSAVIRDVTVSNGMGWSPDARTFYYIDSFAYGIDAFDFDRDTGTVSRKRRLVDVERKYGLCDGMTVDSDGGLWVALFGGWALRRYRPDGSLDRELRLPVSQVTSCTFGGSDWRDLYITTASITERGRLTEADLKRQPHAGAIFVARPGVQGLPTNFCAL